MIRGIGGKRPQLGSGVFIADGAQVIGDVILGEHASIWFNCVVRADVGAVRIGARSNLQDLSVIHVSGGVVNEKFDTTIGADVSVGHRAVLHGCTVGDGCLIGIGAVVLDGAEIGANTIIGANALVTPGTKIPSGVLALGSPARVIRDLTAAELANRKPHAAAYVALAARHLGNTE